MDVSENPTRADGVQTPDEWSKLLGINVHDPDGWRRDSKPWSEPLTEEEFRQRAARSTCGMPVFRPSPADVSRTPESNVRAAYAYLSDVVRKFADHSSVTLLNKLQIAETAEALGPQVVDYAKAGNCFYCGRRPKEDGYFTCEDCNTLDNEDARARAVEQHRPSAPVSHITDDMVEKAAAAVDAREWADLSPQEIAGVVLSAALAGCTVALPEPNGTWSDGVPYWEAEGRKVMAQVDESGRPYTRLNGQIWLVTEAESVGLALVAAAREARRLAGGSVSPKGGETNG